MAKVFSIGRLFRKIGITLLKAIPILPVTLLNDYVWFKIFEQFSLYPSATVSGLMVTAFVNMTDIVVVLLYADLLGLFDWVTSKRR